MSVIDEVKQRVDIVDVVGQYAKLTKSGRTMRGLCPFHSEKHPSFFVYPEQQSWHCFGACNTGGDVFSFVMKKEDIDFGEALRLLAQRAGVTLDKKSETKTKEADRLYQANDAAAQFFHDLLIHSPSGEKARNYVAGRGISLKTTTDFHLGYSPNKWEALKQHLLERGYTEAELSTAGLVIESEEGKTHDRFRHRLMFPICDIRGRVTGFGARALDDSLPKYTNSPQTPTFDKSGNLYGINLAKQAIRKQNTAVIVEGYMDTITTHQNGFNNVVASMGTAITEKQVNTIKRIAKNVGLVLALDADEAGEEAMLRGVSYENTLDAEVKVVILPQGKDPDDVIKEDAKVWQSLLEEALPIMDYTFDMVTARLDLTTAKDKSSAVDELLPIIAEIKNPVRQAHYLQKLARLVSVSERNLEAALRRIKPSQSRYQGREPKQEAMAQALRPVFSSPLEEYCLALLLQHPEFKASSQQPSPEYFESSENREIFVGWQKAKDLSSLKEGLDPAIWEHVDTLITKPLTKSAVGQEFHDFVAKTLPPTQIERYFIDSVTRLRGKYLKSLETKRAALLTLEAEAGGTAAELAKLKEQGIEVSVQLGEVFAEEGRKARSKGAEK